MRMGYSRKRLAYDRGSESERGRRKVLILRICRERFGGSSGQSTSSLQQEDDNNFASNKVSLVNFLPPFSHQPDLMGEMTNPIQMRNR